jgi:hypothetical protein
LLIFVKFVVFNIFSEVKIMLMRQTVYRATRGVAVCTTAR